MNKNKEGVPLISYTPLWQTLKQKNITQYQLINNYGISTGTLDALRKNKSVTLNTIQDLCYILECPIQDVVIIEFLDKKEQ